MIGLGCNNFGRGLDQAGANTVVEAALDAGITFFDTSNNYGGGESEKLLADALGSHRDDVVIASKFGGAFAGTDDQGSAAPAYVEQMLEHSLRQLRTDHIDLYQLHKPDPDTPIEATLEVLAKAIAKGQVREIACSNFSAAQWQDALRASERLDIPGFIANQVEYSMVQRSPEINGLTKLCRGEGLALIPYYPLASGLLTGKLRPGERPTGRLRMERYRDFLTDENFALVEGLSMFAAERGVAPVQVALGWLQSKPEVPSITAGAMNAAQVRANAATVDWQPSDDDLAALGELLEEAC